MPMKGSAAAHGEPPNCMLVEEGLPVGSACGKTERGVRKRSVTGAGRVRDGRCSMCPAAGASTCAALTSGNPTRAAAVVA